MANPRVPSWRFTSSKEKAGIDPQTEEYVSFLNELYDEQFNEALSSLVDEAAAVYEANFANEHRKTPIPPVTRRNVSSTSTLRRSSPRRRP